MCSPNEESRAFILKLQTVPTMFSGGQSSIVQSVCQETNVASQGSGATLRGTTSCDTASLLPWNNRRC